MLLWRCQGCESTNPYPTNNVCSTCGREISSGQKELYNRIDFLTSQAEDGNIYAAITLYGILKQDSQFVKDSGEALRWLGFAAEYGDPQAQFELAKLFYFQNDIVKQNDDEAFKWFSRAMDSGSPYAKHYVAYCYIYGVGAAEDEQKGFSLLLESAEEGNPDSMEMLGRCYKHGIGVSADDEKSFYWLESASEIDDFELSPKAAFELGCYYYFGEVIEEDEESAVPYFEIAYKDGNQMAGVMLGVIFYNFGDTETIQAAKNVWTQVSQSDDAEAARRAQQYLDKAFNTERITYSIDREKCFGCSMCARKCPSGAITITNYIAPGKKRPSYVIDQQKCTKCGTCLNVCKFRAIVKSS